MCPKRHKRWALICRQKLDVAYCGRPINSYTNIHNIGSERVNLNIQSVGLKPLINNSLIRTKSFDWSDLIKAFSQVQLFALS